MTECDLNEKMFTLKQDLTDLYAEYSMHTVARKAIFDGVKPTIHVNGNIIDVPNNLVYMCSAIISCKQSELLDRIQKKCSELVRIIEEYKKEEEKDIV